MVNKDTTQSSTYAFHSPLFTASCFVLPTDRTQYIGSRLYYPFPGTHLKTLIPKNLKLNSHIYLYLVFEVPLVNSRGSIAILEPDLYSLQGLSNPQNPMLDIFMLRVPPAPAPNRFPVFDLPAVITPRRPVRCLKAHSFDHANTFHNTSDPFRSRIRESYSGPP